MHTNIDSRKGDEARQQPQRHANHRKQPRKSVGTRKRCRRMASPAQWQGKSLQLHGYVVPGSIYRARNDSLEWRFKVESKGSTVNASYHGVVPDTFKDEAEVVLRGKLTDSGFNVVPNGVMAKCPSKYEPKNGVKPSTSN